MEADFPENLLPQGIFVNNQVISNIVFNIPMHYLTKSKKRGSNSKGKAAILVNSDEYYLNSIRVSLTPLIPAIDNQ